MLDAVGVANPVVPAVGLDLLDTGVIWESILESWGYRYCNNRSTME